MFSPNYFFATWLDPPTLDQCPAHLNCVSRPRSGKVSP